MTEIASNGSSEHLKSYVATINRCRSLKTQVVLNAAGLGPDFEEALSASGASRVVSQREDHSVDVVIAYLGSWPIKDWAGKIDHFMSVINQDGIAIFEIPTAGGLFEDRLVPTVWENSLQMVPSLTAVRQHYLKKWASRDIGSGPSDLRNRRTMLFSAQVKRPSVIFFGAKGGSGKTTLAASLNSYGCPVLHFDFILSELLYLQKTSNVDSLEFLKSVDTHRIGSSVDELVEAGKAEMLANALVEYFDYSQSVIVAEGYVLYPDKLRLLIEEKLKQKGFKVFHLSQL